MTEKLVSGEIDRGEKKFVMSWQLVLYILAGLGASAFLPSVFRNVQEKLRGGSNEDQFALPSPAQLTQFEKSQENFKKLVHL